MYTYIKTGIKTYRHKDTQTYRHTDTQAYILHIYILPQETPLR
jgi:hypothetical protein